LKQANTNLEGQIDLLNKDKDKFEQKILNLKSLVNEIKEKYELELNRKTEIKDKIIFQLTNKIDSLEK